MKRFRDAAAMVVLVAIMIRVAAEVLEPVIPLLVVVFGLSVLMWIVFGRTKGL